MTIYESGWDKDEYDTWVQNIKIRKKEEIMTTPCNVFITPIAKKYNDELGKPCSRRDWDEQIERSISGEQIMWDGPPPNITQPMVGDLMIIWKYKIGITIFRITKVLDPSNRLESWTKNIGQRDRKVVYLDSPIDVSWDHWIQLGGHRRCMGTSICKKVYDNIINYWKNYSSPRLLSDKNKL